MTSGFSSEGVFELTWISCPENQKTKNEFHSQLAGAEILLIKESNQPPYYVVQYHDRSLRIPVTEAVAEWGR